MVSGTRDSAASEAVTNRKGDWMQTASGKQYWPLDPRAEEVDPVDIAHHLSLLCRYCGASSRHYSVAEHTLGVLRVGQLEAERRLTGISRFGIAVSIALLLHDAAEAYCHDLIRPIKRCVEGYSDIEAANHQAILNRFHWRTFDLSCHDDLVKQADNAMLLAEQSMLMRPAPANWAPVDVPEAMIEDAKRYLRQSKWKIWRRWSWWNKRAMLCEMRRLGLV